MQNILIIYNRKPEALLYFSLMFCSIALSLLLIGSSYLSLGIIKTIVQVILSLLLIMLIFGLCYSLCVDYSKPIACISNEGMWVKYHGFIAWSDIENVFEYQSYGTPLICIGITIKNYEAIFRQSSISGKLSLFWAKIFGHPHVILANIDVENEKVIEYAKNLLKPNNR